MGGWVGTYRGGAAKDADASGERRLEAGLALLALQRLDERSLLPTNVSASATVEVDIEVIPRAWMGEGGWVGWRRRRRRRKVGGWVGGWDVPAAFLPSLPAW